MKKVSTAFNGPAGDARWSLMSKRMSTGNHVRLRGQITESKEKQEPRQETRERPFSAAFPSNEALRSHQRRWSADFTKCGTSPVIIIKKNKKEPRPPQRGVSLLRPHSASHSSAKRYSCPPIGTFCSPAQRSSLSSYSSTSSCSSPPPVQTSAITGPDPLGWKLRPKSNCTSSQPRHARLSLQIPLPDNLPERKSSPAPLKGPISQTKPPVKSKPHHCHHRRHSDSSAFLRPLETPRPVVTVEELYAVQLRNINHEDNDVFSEGNDKKSRQPHKIPPPVAEKTPMARQVAQLMAHSCQHYGVAMNTTKEEIIYSSVAKPKPTYSHQSEDLQTKTARLCLESSSDRERSTPRFPG